MARLMESVFVISARLSFCKAEDKKLWDIILRRQFDGDSSDTVTDERQGALLN